MMYRPSKLKIVVVLAISAFMLFAVLPYVLDLITMVVQLRDPDYEGVSLNIGSLLGVLAYAVYMLFFDNTMNGNKKDPLTKKVTKVRSVWGVEDLEHKDKDELSKNPLEDKDG